VVFEILSPGNIQTEMSRKLLFYTIDGWISPRLGVRFELTDPELKLYHPDSHSFTTYTEEKQRADKLAAKLKELGINTDEL
jgi:hypothetical protein